MTHDTGGAEAAPAAGAGAGAGAGGDAAGRTGRRRKRIRDIVEKKGGRDPITVITSYDYALAALCDRAGVDILLVGDSAGMVMLGYESTIPVTMEEMCTFTGAVGRARKESVVVADMPFMSYQAGADDAVRNAGRLVRAGADAIKMEGGAEMAPRVRAVADAGIPVMGHVGLQPQTAPLAGGYRVQGRTATEAKELLDDATAVEEAGAFAIVFEMVAREAASAITGRLSVPTIGIGSGPGCDGQVLVLHDMLGLYGAIRPKFAKRYRSLSEDVTAAVSAYVGDVARGEFPAPENTFAMDEGEYGRLADIIGAEAEPSRRGA